MPDQQSYTDGAGRENVFIILTLWRQLTVDIDHPGTVVLKRRIRVGQGKCQPAVFLNLNPHM